MKQVREVPRRYAALLDNSDDAYVITNKELRERGQDIYSVANGMLGGCHSVVRIAKDDALRMYYIFVQRGHEGSTGST